MTFFVLLLAVLFFTPSRSTAQLPGDEHWDYRFGIPGTSYYQYVVAVDPRNGDVYAAGDAFTMSGTNRSTTNISKWTRSTGKWSSLGSGLANSTNGDFAEVMGVNPVNGNLYVGGNFSTAGGVSVKNFAMWNGTTWSAANNNTSITPSAIAFNPANGDMYVAGSFSSIGGTTAANIAKWDGTSWSALGSGTNGEIYTLAFDQNSGILYAGGIFSTAGGKPIKALAKWNGSDWDSVGFSVYRGNNAGRVHSLCVNGSNLYITGDFTKIGSATVNYVAQWNGSSWSQLGNINLSSSGGADAIASIGSQVFIGGDHSISGALDQSFITRWDGTQWLAVGGGITGFASTRVTELATYGDDLIVCAPQMSATGNCAAKNYAMYNTVTQRWSPLGSPGTLGLDHYAGRMAMAPDGAIYFAGGFKAAGNSVSPGIAKWDGTSWSNVAKGMIFGLASAPEPRSVAVAPNGDIYVGGKLSQGINSDGSKSANASYIIRYSGGTWSNLGVGLDDDDVYAIAFSGSTVYVGGNFKVYNNSKIRYIAKWTGSAWDSVGIGIPVNGTVRTLAVAPNGDLYAGGSFTTVAGNASIKYLARWNGTTWDSVGGSPNGAVQQIKFKGNDMYIAGDFTSIAGNAISGMAKWNGALWDTISSGLSGIATFDFQGDTIFASGNSIMLDEVTTTTTAYWDGSKWNGMGSGLQSENQLGGPGSTVAGQILVKGDDVYFTGGFNLAGNKPSMFVARWNSGQTISSVREQPGTTLPNTFALEQNYPNPFNPKTDFRFSILSPSFVTLKIYDVLGREITTLVNEQLHAGKYEVSWSAETMPSGIYFYRLQAGEFTETKRMVLMK